MGVAETMTKSQELKELMEKYEKVKKCFCGNWSIPSTETVYEEYDDATILELRNFPVFKCTKCDDFTVSPTDYLKFTEMAAEHFDNTGEKVFDCEKVNG